MKSWGQGIERLWLRRDMLLGQIRVECPHYISFHVYSDIAWRKTERKASTDTKELPRWARENVYGRLIFNWWAQPTTGVTIHRPTVVGYIRKLADSTYVQLVDKTSKD